MSKIAVIMKETANESALASRIKRITALGLSTIIARLRGGGPIGEWVLFQNDHEDVANLLREMIEIQFRGEGLIRFFELEVDEPFKLDTAERFEISADTLKNILDAHDRQQAKLDDQ